MDYGTIPCALCGVDGCPGDCPPLEELDENGLIDRASTLIAQNFAKRLNTPEGYEDYVKRFGGPPVFFEGMDICIVQPPYPDCTQ